MTTSNIKKRGFGSMDAATRRSIASSGGKAAHQRGTAHKYTSEEAVLAGRKGAAARKAKRDAEIQIHINLAEAQSDD